jgi:hypothetical protein
MIFDGAPLRFEGIGQISSKAIGIEQVSSSEFARLPRSVARSDSAVTHADGRQVKAAGYAMVGKQISEAVVALNSVPGAAARTFHGSSTWEEIV